MAPSPARGRDWGAVWDPHVMVGHIGQRIATYRRRRGLSQAALAGLVGRSESWMSQIERGVRSVDRLSVLMDLARVLQVEVESLSGRPWPSEPNHSAVSDGLGDLRRVLTNYASLTGGVETATTGASAAELSARITHAHRAYQAADYDLTIRLVPGLVSAVESDQGRRDGPRRDALLSCVSAYVVAAKLVTKLGAGDLAILAADRAARAAVAVDSLAARSMAAYQVTCALMRSSQADDAERVAVEMATQVAPHAKSDDPELVSLCGALWLVAAVIAARRTDRGEAWSRLDQAERLAWVLGADGNHGWTGFGPTNVAIHRVSVAAVLGDPREALRAAARIDVSRLPAGLSSRRAQINLDLAWAHAQRKRDAEATLQLLEAERVAPQVIRHNLTAQRIVRNLLARGSRAQTSVLVSLARRSGVLE